MNKNNVHVVPYGNKWAVKLEGHVTYHAITDTQTEAIRIGRELAKSYGSELVIHRPDGTIRDKDSYGNDPYPPKG